MIITSLLPRDSASYRNSQYYTDYLYPFFPLVEDIVDSLRIKVGEDNWDEMRHWTTNCQTEKDIQYGPTAGTVASEINTHYDSLGIHCLLRNLLDQFSAFKKARETFKLEGKTMAALREEFKKEIIAELDKKMKNTTKQHNNLDVLEKQLCHLEEMQKTFELTINDHVNQISAMSAQPRPWILSLSTAAPLLAVLGLFGIVAWKLTSKETSPEGKGT